MVSIPSQANVGMNASFSASLEQLREFIAKNFEPENIHAASNSRFR